MSFMDEFYTWVNDQGFFPSGIAFDVHPENPPDPYYSFTPVSDEGTTGEFCADDSGRTVLEFNGYGTDKKMLFDSMDSLRQSIVGARNSLATYELWNTRCTGVVGYATEDVRVYRYSFDLETMWRRT